MSSSLAPTATAESSQGLSGVAAVAPGRPGATQRSSLAPSPGPGRNRVTTRALTRVITAVTAAQLRVAPRQIAVDLEDNGGELSVTVRAPIQLVSPQRVAADPAVVARSGGTVLQRAALAQENIRSDSQLLTGSRIARVTLRLVRAEIGQERRVR